MTDIYHLDTGVIIQLGCKTDVSDALEQKIMIKKPSGTIVEVLAEQGDDDNKIKYTILAAGSLFSEQGDYQLRAKIKFSETQTQQGDPVRLNVGAGWVIS